MLIFIGPLPVIIAIYFFQDLPTIVVVKNNNYKNGYIDSSSVNGDTFSGPLAGFSLCNFHNLIRIKWNHVMVNAY